VQKERRHVAGAIHESSERHDIGHAAADVDNTIEPAGATGSVRARERGVRI